MKILNFTVVEILPALLNKAKTQTIRRAFMINREGYGKAEKLTDLEKPPRFKVGDIVQIMWNQRSKYEWFCKGCGKGIDYLELKGGEKLFQCPHCPHHYYPQQFNKHLGNVKITEVFKIEICKQIEPPDAFRIMTFGNSLKPDSEFKFADMHYCKECPSHEIGYFAKRDGFATAEDMFKTLGEMYDLSQPKPFWVYRWEWNNALPQKYVAEWQIL